jgi:carboxymethylenebutenolidase
MPFTATSISWNSFAALAPPAPSSQLTDDHQSRLSCGVARPAAEIAPKGFESCAMIEKDVNVTSRNGPIPSFAVCPEGTGPFPGIILYMDAPGIREELRNLARRIAKHGYFCLLPDMYYRLGSLRFDMVRRAEGMRPTMFAAMNSLTNALITEDTAAWLGFLDAQEKVKPGPIGCVGYCMSGRYVTTVAARYSNRIAAAASLYGVGIVTDAVDSPHLLIDRI